MPTKRLTMRRIHRLMTLRFGAGATAQDGFVPRMRGLEGFRSYYLLGGGPDVIITTTSLGFAVWASSKCPRGSPVCVSGRFHWRLTEAT